MALELHMSQAMKSIDCLHLDAEALQRVLGAGQAVYNTLNTVMPYVDSTWKSQSCIERASSFGMYGNMVSGGLGIASGVATATGIGAGAAPLLGAGAIVVGTGTSITGTTYLKQCNAIEAKK